MKPYLKRLLKVCFAFILVPGLSLNQAKASHSEGADITYKCLGGNQYEITLSFYRDCNGVAAPGAATINCFSATLGQNIVLNLMPIPGTGQEIPLVCSSALTQCAGGTYPGVQEWIYRGVTTLAPASDWIFSFDLCCRNAAITTIINPGNQNIHVESTLDNLNFPCNSSPVFSTKPVPFACVNQSYTLNHGASDPDGDLLTYELITPMNGAGTFVTYLVPYTYQQPLTSNPALGIDTLTGDISMLPTMIEVTILSVKVKQWRNGQLTGTVIRDIQLRTMQCNNTYPYISGISGSFSFFTSACVGTNLTFPIFAHDPDTSQGIQISWNGTIPGASFVVSGAGTNSASATFNWTPAISDTGVHCFAITVTDDNCPINGKQTFAICIIVTGFEVNLTSTNSNCGASNGTATAQLSGGTAPFNYAWNPCGCQQNPLNGISAGSYTIVVTDAKGCTATDSINVYNNGSPGNLIVTSTPVSCAGGNDGTATANANGGQPPYSYQWSTGATNVTVTGLSAGIYAVTAFTAQGCTKTQTVIVTEPALLTVSVNATDAACNGLNSGTASVLASGGTAPFSYMWSNGATTSMVSGLISGNYFVTTTDANGCTSTQNLFINQPPLLQADTLLLLQPKCYGDSSGSISIYAIGGVAPFTYQWNTQPVQTGAVATGLSAGSYSVWVTDQNGCTTNLNINLSQPLPLANTVVPNHVKCFGTAGGSAYTVSSGGTLPYTYVWSNGQTGSSVSGMVTGNYSLVVTDNNGCTLANQFQITQPPALQLSVVAIQDVSCHSYETGSAQVIASGGVNPYTYSWNNGQSAAIATALLAGVYTVTATDSNSCTVNITLQIDEPDTLLAFASPSFSVCPGDSGTITASAQGGVIPYTYQWLPGFGPGASQLVTPSATTAFGVFVTDANGCTAIAHTTVYVHQPTVNAFATSSGAICNGQTATLNGSATGLGPFTYHWTHNPGATIGPVLVSPSSTTTYTILVTGLCGATDTAMTNVIVNPLPKIDLQPLYAKDCGKVLLTFADLNPANAGFTYHWDFGDGSVSSQANPVHVYQQPGIYTVSVIATSNFGCVATAITTANADVVAPPLADFTSDPQLSASIYYPKFRFFDQSLNADTWLWDFGDGNQSQQQNPEHVYKEKGIYTVTLLVWNDGICIDSIVKTVEIKPEFTFYVPNAFTPNGDHLNDNFTGKGTEVAEFEMAIYDRWGMEIFRTTDLEKGWDGYANGGSEIAQQDVYVYKIVVRDFQGKPHHYTGHVNLVK